MVGKASGAYHKIAFLACRAKKLAYQRFNPSPTEPIPLFLVGCQRSGTNMVMDVLDRSYETWTYNEADKSPAFENYRIRTNAVLDSLLQKARARCVVFKPLCDSQWVDHLLSIRPNAKAIWLYRDYRDVAWSAERKWGEHQKDVIRRIARGHIVAAGWRAERITGETMAVIKQLYSPAMSAFEGAALKWYMRNQVYFDLKLEERSDVRLLKYEDLVLNPLQAFPGLFELLGIQYQDRYAEKIFSSSTGGFKNSRHSDEIKRLCGTMLKTFDSIYLAQAMAS